MHLFSPDRRGAAVNHRHTFLRGHVLTERNNALPIQAFADMRRRIQSDLKSCETPSPDLFGTAEDVLRRELTPERFFRNMLPDCRLYLPLEVTPIEDESWPAGARPQQLRAMGRQHPDGFDLTALLVTLQRHPDLAPHGIVLCGPPGSGKETVCRKAFLDCFHGSPSPLQDFVPCWLIDDSRNDNSANIIQRQIGRARRKLTAELGGLPERTQIVEESGAADIENLLVSIANPRFETDQLANRDAPPAWGHAWIKHSPPLLVFVNLKVRELGQKEREVLAYGLRRFQRDCMPQGHRCIVISDSTSITNDEAIEILRQTGLFGVYGVQAGPTARWRVWCDYYADNFLRAEDELRNKLNDEFRKFGVTLPKRADLPSNNLHSFLEAFEQTPDAAIGLPLAVHQITIGSAEPDKIRTIDEKKPERPKRVYGRERDLEELEALSATTLVLAITGVPGVGTTTLVQQFARDPRRWCRFEHLFWTSFDRSGPLFSDVSRWFLKAIGAEDRISNSTRYQVNAVVDGLTSHRVLWILDGFEWLLNEDGKLQPHFAAFGQLLTHASSGAIGKSLLLITSLIPPRDDKDAPIRSFSVDGLKDEDAVSLLRELTHNHNYAISSELAYDAARKASGVPNWLRFIAGCATDEHKLQELLQSIEDERAQELEWLKNWLSEHEQVILGTVSAFHGVAAVGAIAFALEEPSGTVQRGLDGLVGKDLLSRRGSGEFAISDALRPFAARQLDDPAHTHRAIAGWYRNRWRLSQPPGSRKPKDLDAYRPLFDACHHLTEAGDLDDACRCLFDDILGPEDADRWVSDHLVACCERLVSPYHTLPATPLSSRNRARVMTLLSWQYSACGRYDEALDRARDALDAAHYANDPEEEANAQGRLGAALFDLGQSREALRHIRRAIKKGRRIPSPSRRLARTAVWWNQVALILQRGAQPPDLLGLAGLSALVGACIDKLRQRKARACLRRAIRLADTANHRMVAGRCCGTLGLCYLEMGATRMAKRYLVRARDIAHAEKDTRYEGDWLVNLGLCSVLDESNEDGMKCFDEAWHIYFSSSRPGERATFFRLKAYALELTKAFDEAESLYLESERLAALLGDELLRGLAKANLGFMQERRRFVRKASELLREAVCHLRNRHDALAEAVQACADRLEAERGPQ